MTAPSVATGGPEDSAHASERLGELLLSQGLLTREQLAAALQEHRSSHHRLGLVLVRRGIIGELDLTRVLARQYRMQGVDLTKFEIDPRTIKLIPGDVAMKRTVLPLRREGRTLTVAVADPADQGLLEDLKFMTRYDIFAVLAGEETLRGLIERHYESGDEQLQSILSEMEGVGDDVEVVTESDDDAAAQQAAVDDAPVVRLINGILTEAVRRGASDIHVEPFEHEIRIRYRIDGTLLEIMKPPLKMRAALTSRIKILSQLNIAERRVPQDGRLKLKMGTRVIDFRVSTLPVLFGEKIVLRILDKGNLTLDLTKFGFEQKAEADLMKAILSPYGMVLVTGPTGSGKTTTLYSALQRINTVETNIMTAEDPVEYNLPGINQAPMRAEIGLTFAAALRAFLRQDPNVIMIGEIRDLETGGIAIKAALTGHLVLSTLHTNDAPSTIVRMIDMGIEAFNVASAVNLVVAQRLVRRICAGCKAPALYNEVELQSLRTDVGSLRETVLYRGTGCDQCGGTGYRGRAGLYEVMAMSPALRRMILTGASTVDLREKAVSEGMLTLRMDGIKKLERGITTLEEVVKETSE
jgi:type IV pilus assembly protein PilB